jgi:hypothetical protein
VLQQQPETAAAVLEACLRAEVALGINGYEVLMATVVSRIGGIAGAAACAADALFTNNTSSAAAAFTLPSARQKQQLLQQQLALQSLLLTCLKAAAVALAEQHSKTELSEKLAFLAVSKTLEASTHLAAAAAASSTYGSISWQNPAAQWVLLLARGLILTGQLLQQQDEELNSEYLPPGVIQACLGACTQLLQQLPHLQLVGAPAAAAVASADAQTGSSSSSSSSQQHQKLLKLAEQLQQALGAHAESPTMQHDQQQQLGQQLIALGQALCCALPSKHCCNNPGCSNLTRVGEVALVSGKGCVCSR